MKILLPWEMDDEEYEITSYPESDDAPDSREEVEASLLAAGLVDRVERQREAEIEAGLRALAEATDQTPAQVAEAVGLDLDAFDGFAANEER